MYNLSLQLRGDGMGQLANGTSIIIIIVFLISKVICLPYNGGFSPNKRFTAAGKYTISINNLNNYNYDSYPIDLEYQGSELPSCLASIGGLNIQVKEYLLDIFLEVTTCGYYKMTVTAKTNRSNLISRLDISYFAIKDNNLQGEPFRYYSYQGLNSFISKDPSTFRLININYDYFTYYYCNGNCVYDNQMPLKAIVLLNGFKVKNSILVLSLSLAVDVQPTTDNSKKVKVYIGSKSDQLTYVETIAFTVFLHRSPHSGNHNNQKVLIYSQKIGSNSGNFQYSNGRHIMLPFNTFVGLSSFYISNQQSLNFQYSISDNSIISVTSSQEHQINYIIAYSQWCSFLSPYFEPLTSKCFDFCPRWFRRNLLQCQCAQYNSCINEATTINEEFKAQTKQQQSIFFYYQIMGYLIFVFFIYFFTANCRRKTPLKKIKQKNNKLKRMIENANTEKGLNEDIIFKSNNKG